MTTMLALAVIHLVEDALGLRNTYVSLYLYCHYLRFAINFLSTINPLSIRASNVFYYLEDKNSYFKKTEILT